MIKLFNLYQTVILYQFSQQSIIIIIIKKKTIVQRWNWWNDESTLCFSVFPTFENPITKKIVFFVKRKKCNGFNHYLEYIQVPKLIKTVKIQVCFFSL